MSSDTERSNGTTEQSDATTTPAGPSTESGDRYSAESKTPRLHPALIATAVALPVALVVAVLVIAVMSNRHATREPLALGSVPAPAAAGQACTALLPALPDKLGDYTRAELAQPARPPPSPGSCPTAAIRSCCAAAWIARWSSTRRPRCR